MQLGLSARTTAVAIFLAASTFVTIYGRNERSGWILMTSPEGRDHRFNTLLGYCFLHKGNPFMKENISHAAQVGVFCGARDALQLSEAREDFRILRPLYSLLASLPAPLLGTIPAMLLINWLSWALSAWVAWRLTLDVFGDELAAVLAVIFVSGAIGMTVHIADYSPHLLAFATYYFGVWLLYRSNIYREVRPWRTHFRLSVYLAICCLAYNTGVMLTAVYVLVAVRRNRLVTVLGAALFALASRPVFQAALGSRIHDVETEYLGKSLLLWRELFTNDLVYIAKTLLRWSTEYLFFFDSPLVVLAGLACVLWIKVPRQLYWFGLAVVAIPFAAAFVFTPMATARGYIVFSGTVWLYACLAHQLSRGLRSDQRLIHRIVGAAVAVLVVTHFAWSTAHFAHILGPVKTYFLGWDDGDAYLRYPAAEIISLTDQEPSPVLFGGQTTLSAAGALSAGNDHVLDTDQVSFTFALLTRGWFFGYFALLALACSDTMRQKVVAISLTFSVYVAGCLLAAALFRTSPAFFPVDRALALPALQTLRYEVSLGSKFLETFEQSVADGDTIVLHFPTNKSGEHRDVDLLVAFRAGEHRLPIVKERDGKGLIYQLAGSSLTSSVSGIVRERRLVVEVTNQTTTNMRVVGWQKSTLPMRRCEYLRGSEVVNIAPEALPALELRIIRPNGRIKLAGF